MQARILGTETEYALYCASEEEKVSSRLGGEPLLEHLTGLASQLVSAMDTLQCPFAGEYLANGGRFYIDRGGHPEYATPECTQVRDVIAHEKAGDRILRQLVKAANSRPSDGRSGARLRIIKNNVDWFGTTYGGHENYLVSPDVTERVHAIIPFLVTRQVFTGNGRVTGKTYPEDVPYQLSQRADFIDRVFSDRTSQVRGIINVRRREVPRPGHNVRFHLVVGDSNMSEYALALKVGVTSLVLRMVEDDSVTNVPALASPVHAVKATSRKCNAKLALAGGKGSSTAIDIQRRYFEQAHRFCEARGASSEETEILNLWGETLDGLSRLKITDTNSPILDDPAGMRHRLDWVLKLWLIGRVQAHNDLAWDDPRLRVLDMSYHDLDPAGSVFERCRALGLVDCWVEEEDILKAVTEPPPDTRASTRGKIIRMVAARNAVAIVENWEKISVVANLQQSGRIHPFNRNRRIMNRLKMTLEDPFDAGADDLLKQVQEFIGSWDREL